jgi:hypothetical protein
MKRVFNAFLKLGASLNETDDGPDGVATLYRSTNKSSVTMVPPVSLLQCENPQLREGLYKLWREEITQAPGRSLRGYVPH